MQADPLYVYVVCAGQTNGTRRSHAQSVAARVRFSIESMMHPVFVATNKNESQHQQALARADVLLITEDDPARMQDPFIVQALQAFAKKADGRIVVYARTPKTAQGIADALFVRESPGTMNELLQVVLDMQQDTAAQQDDVCQAMQEQDAPPAGKFENIRSIVFICAFIAAACLILRLVLTLIAK